MFCPPWHCTRGGGKGSGDCSPVAALNQLLNQIFEGFKVEFFRNPNIDFLGKKWYFLAFSLIFSTAGILSMLFWHDIPLGVDFRGGTLVYVKFTCTAE